MILLLVKTEILSWLRSFLPDPSLDRFPEVEDYESPGEMKHRDSHISLNSERRAVFLEVVNNGDSPVQVGSHYHFIETNPSLTFDRRKAYRMRLIIPAGTATRFEPGDWKTVTLVSIGGKRCIRGGSNIADGPVDDTSIEAIMAVRTRGFGQSEERNAKFYVTAIRNSKSIHHQISSTEVFGFFNEPENAMGSEIGYQYRRNITFYKECVAYVLTRSNLVKVETNFDVWVMTDVHSDSGVPVSWQKLLTIGPFQELVYEHEYDRWYNVFSGTRKDFGISLAFYHNYVESLFPLSKRLVYS